MNLFQLINRGVDASGVMAREVQARAAKLSRNERYQRDAIADARLLWTNALLVDETRAWLSISEQDKPVIQGLVALLTLAGLAKSFDDGGKFDSPELGVIRGGISAATQCAASADCVISALDAQAFSSSAKRARAVFEACSDDAIAHAASQLHGLVHSQQKAV